MAIKNKVILLIDDDPEIIKLLTKIFEVLGVIIVSAANLSEAKQLLYNTIPHLIFLDVKLGDENGLEFLTFLKTLTFGKGIPVIIFSKVDDKKVQALALNNGASDYLIKPIIAREIIQKARKYLNYNGQRPKSTLHIFLDYSNNPQFFKIDALINDVNETYIEVQSSIKIAESSCVQIESSLCDKINFTNPKFTTGVATRYEDTGFFINKFYYLGASEDIIQKAKRLRIK